MDCLLLLCQRMPCPQISREKTFVNSHKTAKFMKVFSLESFPLYGIFSEMVMVTVLDSSDKQLEKGAIGCRE